MADADTTMEFVKFLALASILTLIASIFAINAASKRRETRDIIDREHEGF